MLRRAGAARHGETRRRLAVGESVRAVARALRCGLATVQRARLAVGMRGPAARRCPVKVHNTGAVAAL